ncbi:AIPR family protein [Nocardiopsis sp. FR26]|uniref:AIPR family protein n=1 Tax=Nocardiopsis sp. FR26 TaxID=2605987 RepID=UPI00135B36D2|nr:AIPR family protein [Nocardiopsis sp. FR26]
MSVVQVRHVRGEIEARFRDLIDTTDRPEREREDVLLTRGLSALAVQSEHPCSDMVAAEKIFDGETDRGLDAVAVELRTEQPHICLVQSKWNHKGKAKFGEAEVDAMMYGLDKILDLEFNLFNKRFQKHVPELEQALGGGSPKITLVLALMRTEPLNDDVLRRLDEKIAQHNQVVDMVDYKIFNLRDVHRAILGDAASPKINAKVKLECFGQEHQPQAMYGTMTVPDVAALYAEHGRGLFAKNIRGSLDVSDVNPRIRNTLVEEPHHFWYFSNGITMLCDTVKPIGSARPGSSGSFDLSGASVVNGAQTVTAIHKAYSTNPETAGDGRVLVRLISLENCPPGFGDQVTINTNTQNPIEERDFKSLDEVQIRLRDDFALHLRLSYVIKRGEPMPKPEHGCSITEAAEALAATHQNAELAAQAKREPSALWRDGTYRELFGSEPNVYRVWRCVQLLRAVGGQLSELRDGLLGRAAAAASYGDLLITHVVFRQLVTRAIEDPDTDWESQLARVPGLVEEALNWVLGAIDMEYGPTSQVIAAVRNTERIRRVARHAVSGIAGGKDAPVLDPEYQALGTGQRGRQVGAVRTLVNAGRVPDGTVLEFRPFSRPEQQEMTGWLAEEPKRGQAVWRNTKQNQLQWQADGKWYSPSGLVRKMRRDASGKDQSAQGTRHWHVPGEGSLADLAAQVRAEQGLDVGEESSGM